jgi:CheY-like chemotaxis protein
MIGPDGIILLAEDREGDIRLIQEAFRKAKVPNRLVVARDGEEVVDYFNGRGKYSQRAEWPLPALLLLDLAMPGLDGFGVLEWIRQRPEYNSVIIVVLTMLKESRNIDRAYGMGANSFLAKPDNFEGFEQIALLLVQFWFKFNLARERTGLE